METKEKIVSVKGASAEKKKLPLERDIQREICEALSERKIFFWRTNNIPSLGRFGVDGKARFRAMPKFSSKGVADILCLYNGWFIAMEVKRPGAKLRPEQAEWATKVIMHGGRYVKVTSVAEALKVLDA